MKTEIKLILGRFLIVVTILGIMLLIFFVSNNNEKCRLQMYSKADSTYNARLDSARGEYQQVIDSLATIKPKIVERVKYLKEVDTLIYVGTDSSCIEIIDRKTRRISAQDSLIDELDLEARTYSGMVFIADTKLNLEKKRYENIIYRKDSVYKSVSDSLLAEIKHKKRSLFWQKIKTGFALIAGTTAVIFSNSK